MARLHNVPSCVLDAHLPVRNGHLPVGTLMEPGTRCNRHFRLDNLACHTRFACGLLSPQSGGDFIVNGGAAPLTAIVVLAFSHLRCLSTQLLGCRPLAFLGELVMLSTYCTPPVAYVSRRIGQIASRKCAVHSEGLAGSALPSAAPGGCPVGAAISGETGSALFIEANEAKHGAHIRKARQRGNGLAPAPSGGQQLICDA
jgi:hypothetical protein